MMTKAPIKSKRHSQTTPRLYVTSPLSPGQGCILEGQNHHYLAHVLRGQVGMTVILFNGVHGAWQSTITRLGKRDLHITVVSQQRTQIDLPPLALYLPCIRPKRLDFLLEKATELGVTDFYPLTMDHSAYPWQGGEKYESTWIQAAEQCERLCIPRFHPVQSLETALQNLDIPLAWARERCDTGQAHETKQPTPRALLVGPEGGFSSHECDQLGQHPGVYPITLGSHVLRTETAAITGLFALSQLT